MFPLAEYTEGILQANLLSGLEVMWIVICMGKGKPAGFTWVLVMGPGPGPEILTPRKPVPVGPGHGFCHIDFKLRINSQRHVHLSFSLFLAPSPLDNQ
jgi:hypothetical protein